MVLNIIQVKVQPEALEFVRKQFAPPTDSVFELVPPMFAYYIGKLYAQIGSPKIHSDNVWLVYRGLLQDLEAIEHTMENGDYIDAIERWQVEENLLNPDSGAEIFYPLIDGQSLSGGVDDPRPDGLLYMGGVNGGRGLGMFYSLVRLESLTNI